MATGAGAHFESKTTVGYEGRGEGLYREIGLSDGVREPECETDAQSHLMSEYNIRAPGNRGSLAQQLLECGPDSRARRAVLEMTDG